MRITSDLTDVAIVRILGERVERYRIAAGQTQAELSEQAGIGKRTLERIEAGRGAELVTLIRVLRALDALDGCERLLPELPASPIERLELRGKQRQRVAHPRGRREATERAGEVREGAPIKPWTWDVPAAAGRSPATGARSTKGKK
jgi:transcriptional regulator with XRE-family HTH domain